MDQGEPNEEEAEGAPAQVKSVSAKILGEYFDALDKEDGFSDIAAKLRTLVLDEGVFAEPSIRAALFPNAS